MVVGLIDIHSRNYLAACWAAARASGTGMNFRRTCCGREIIISHDPVEAADGHFLAIRSERDAVHRTMLGSETRDQLRVGLVVNPHFAHAIARAAGNDPRRVGALAPPRTGDLASARKRRIRLKSSPICRALVRCI